MNFTSRGAVAAAACLVAACAFGADAALTPGGGLESDGDEYVISSARFDGTLRTADACPAAWHVFEGEYRTTGIRPEGHFNIDVTAAGGKPRFSGENLLHASPSWSPVRAYFKPDRATAVSVRFHNAKGAGSLASVRVRNARVRRFEFTDGTELLANGDFQGGEPGGVPALWKWKYSGDIRHYQLIEDRSFRTGDQVVRITHDGGRGRTLVSHGLPLPTDGELELSFWARTDKPKTQMNGWLFGDGWAWQYQVSCHPALTDTWRKYTCRGGCPGEIKRSPFFWTRFDYGGNGHIDLAGVSVKWRRAAKNTAEDPWRVGWMGAPGKNLVLNPDFELGFTGWTMAFFGPKHGQVDHNIMISRCERWRTVDGRGLDGTSAMYLPPGPSLKSYCVPFEKKQTYTVSAYMKATKPGATMWWAFIDTSWQMYAKSIKGIPTDRFERYHFTFTYDKYTKKRRGYVRFNAGKAPVLIDRVQFEEGALSPYEAPPAMLALMSKDGQDNVMVRGEHDPEMQLLVVARDDVPDAFEVEVVARDAWERESWKKTYTFPAGETSRETIALPTDRLGTFEVELNARDRGGKTLGVSRSRYSIIDPPERHDPRATEMFAVCFEVYRKPVWVVEDGAKQLERLGAHWARFFCTPIYESKEPHAEFIATLREKMRALKAHGVEPIPCVGFFPKWMGDRIPQNTNPGPEDFALYGEYVREFVRAMKDDVDYWEILNEPNLWNYAKGPKKGQRSMPPEKYIEVLKAAHAAVREADPGAKVLAPCLNGTSVEWTERLLKLGAAKYMDVFSFHSYRSTPDVPDVYPDIMALREVLREYGFEGPILNSEQYFAADLFYHRNNDEETRRGYSTRHDEELRAGTRTIRNFIHHVAAEAPYCAFAPGASIWCEGGCDRMFPYDLYACYNAATRFLARAGAGSPIDMGADVRAFLFPDARGGPLLTVHAIGPQVDGRMKIAERFTAYDMAGNRLGYRDLESGLPVRVDPVYVKFPYGTTAQRITQAVQTAALTGLGDPFGVQVGITARNTVTVAVRNRHNRPLSGRVKLESVPDGWKLSRAEHRFTDAPPGKIQRVPFRFDEMAVESLAEYPVRVLVESGEDFIRHEAKLRPIFAHRARRIRVDGDLRDWRGAQWARLGDDHLSKDFNTELPRRGEADLSARVALSWNASGVALAVEVTDDRHVDAPVPVHAYKGDSLQVYFDAQNDAGAGGRGGYDEDDVTYGVSLIGGRASAYLEKAPTGRYIGEANKASGIDREVSVAIRRGDGVTTYEMLFPKRVLPAASFREGEGLGFSLLINDNDGRGRKVGLTLAPRGSEPYARPEEYRDLLFME